MLEVTGLHAQYGDIRVLFNINLNVKEGETIGIIGPNGAGKTTLLKAISGMIKPSAGKVSFFGQDIDTVAPHKLLTMGLSHVPEHRRLFPRLTVEENLLMGGYTVQEEVVRKERFDWIYSLFPRLKERRKQLAGSMSGGEQQMCAIGRALMAYPKLLMLDEPSAGLAPLIVDSMFDIIREVSKAGITVLIVEQNISQVLSLVDRAYLIEAGHIRLEGDAEMLRDHPEVREAYLGWAE